MTRVVIIYDASYLMSDRKRDPLHTHRLLDCCTITNCVFQETQDEIKRLIERGDAQRRERAAKARKIIFSFMGDANTAFLQEPLKGGPSVSASSPLGHDSSIDGLLLGKAKEFAEKDRFDAVILASNDHGTGIEALKLRKAGLPIYFIADPTDKTLGDLEFNLRFGRSEGSWNPECLAEARVSAVNKQVFFAPDGSSLSCVDIGDRSVRIYKLLEDAGEAPHAIQIEGSSSIPSTGYEPRCHYTSATSLWVATGTGQDQTVNQFRLPLTNNPFPVFSFAAVRSFAFSRDGRMLATARGDAWSLFLQDLVTQQVAGPYEISHLCHALALSADGRLLASAGLAPFNKCELTIDDLGAWQRTGLFSRADGFDERGICSIAFSPDAQFLAAGTFSGIVHVLRLSDMSLIATHRLASGGPLRSLAFQHGENTLAAGVGQSIALFRAPEFAQFVPLEGHKPVKTLHQAPSEVVSLKFSGSGQILVALWGEVRDGLTTEQCALSIWSVPGGQHLLNFTHSTRWMEFDPMSEIVATSDFAMNDDGRSAATVMRLWRLNGARGVRRPLT